MAYFSRKSSGLFFPSGNGFKEVKDAPENFSIIEAISFSGYHKDQVYNHNGVSGGRIEILCISFEIFTRNMIFVLTNTSATYVTERDVKKYLSNFSVTKSYDSLVVKDILETGIENETLTVEYLGKVLKLKNVSPNGVFYSPRIQTYLYFTNGLLTNYQYDDGYFPWTRHLKEVNQTVYDKIAKAAIKYRPNDIFLQQKEINIQAAAWSAIPGAFGNSFIKLHMYDGDSVNLHLLRVVHYHYPITRQEFEEINYGRFVSLPSDVSTIYLSGHFEYHFSAAGEFLKTVQVY